MRRPWGALLRLVAPWPPSRQRTEQKLPSSLRPFLKLALENGEDGGVGFARRVASWRLSTTRLECRDRRSRARLNGRP